MNTKKLGQLHAVLIPCEILEILLKEKHMSVWSVPLFLFGFFFFEGWANQL